METKFQTLITGLQHIGIPTNDMEKTVAFYRILGFETALQTVNHAADEKVTFLRMGEVTLEVYENKKAAMVPGALDHIALNVTDIEKAFQLAKEQEGHKMIKTFPVKLQSVDMVKGFVNDMSQMEGDVLLLSGKYVIDAKSIMGIFSLDLSQPLQIQIEDWKEEYVPVIEKYLSA